MRLPASLSRATLAAALDSLRPGLWGVAQHTEGLGSVPLKVGEDLAEWGQLHPCLFSLIECSLLLGLDGQANTRVCVKRARKGRKQHLLIRFFLKKQPCHFESFMGFEQLLS